MIRFFFILFLFTLEFAGNVSAQDTLPKISVKLISSKVLISWKNSYGARISNINIQRSSDSLKRFYTVGTILNPMNRENGYVDTKPPLGRIFYRVFVAFEGGDYVFSKSYKPELDTTVVSEVMADLMVEDKKEAKVLPSGFVPSKFVYTGKDNNVIINLPGAEGRKFSIKFFDEAEKPVFELSSIKEPYLILEKVNFLHAGWFNYQLFDNNILLEKFKFYIPKDGKNGTNANHQRR
ncbi:MAG: hypothetical protein Q7T76_16515 [Ferruginibacter sp.]|nr:hypothetical protein [Ferruginibacter sp.]